MALTEGGLSPADIMAMTNNDGANGFGGAGGTWIWVFFLFFLLAWGGGGMFGGSDSAATQGALTRAELSDGLGRQDLFRNQDMIYSELSAFERDIANKIGDIQYDTLTSFNSIGQQIAQNKYDTMVGINSIGTQISGIDRNIDSVKYENAKNTCEIINTNNLNTRELLANQNAGIQKVLDYLTNDKIEGLRTDLQSANLTIQNMTQTNALLNNLRPYPMPAYITASPYTSTYNSGCGCGV